MSFSEIYFYAGYREDKLTKNKTSIFHHLSLHLVDLVTQTRSGHRVRKRKRLEAFETWHYRRLLRIFRFYRVTNNNFLQQIVGKKIINAVNIRKLCFEQIMRRKKYKSIDRGKIVERRLKKQVLVWTRHTHRKRYSLVGKMIEKNPVGRRPLGRPRLK